MSNLNSFELDVINHIALNHPPLTAHVKYLSVIKREYTGVGLYIHFSYTATPAELLSPLNNALSSDDVIKVGQMDDIIFYELNITDGKIDFLEFITLSSSWDGDTTGYRFAKGISD